MGKALQSGMVLVMSLWDDYSANMLWLDSDYPTTGSPSTPGVSRGPCSTTSGNPPQVESQSGSAKVIFSNIKVGDLGSTYGNGNEPVPGGPSGGGGGSSSSAPPPPPSSSTGGSPPSTSTRSTGGGCTGASTTVTVYATVTVPPNGPTATVTPNGPTTTASPGGGTVAKYGQCGGNGWTGGTVCASGSTCQASNQWYSQCL